MELTTNNLFKMLARK